jgi:hypothetical protein
MVSDDDALPLAGSWPGENDYRARRFTDASFENPVAFAFFSENPA